MAARRAADHQDRRRRARASPKRRTTQRLYLVPAFTGLGAPYWDPDCRGAIFGLTRNSGPAEIAKRGARIGRLPDPRPVGGDAADWDGAGGSNVLRVDGGMTASDWTMQFLADILGAPVDRPEVLETTALGAAWVAGMQAGVYPGFDEFSRKAGRSTGPSRRRWTQAMREARYAGWKDAVSRTLSDPWLTPARPRSAPPWRRCARATRTTVNIATVTALAARGRVEGAELLCLPEVAGLMNRNGASRPHAGGRGRSRPFIAACRDLAAKHGLWIHIGSTPVLGRTADSSTIPP
jgi:hypothetical protein